MCILYTLICVVLHKYLEFSICGYKHTYIHKVVIQHPTRGKRTEEKTYLHH